MSTDAGLAEEEEEAEEDDKEDKPARKRPKTSSPGLHSAFKLSAACGEWGLWSCSKSAHCWAVMARSCLGRLVAAASCCAVHHDVSASWHMMYLMHHCAR